MSLSLLIHDYAGHPFQAELARELARRGHRVTHAWFAGDPGPKGALARRAGDPETLGFHPITIPAAYSKTRLLARRAGDVAYGRALAALIANLRPDIVISGNTPTEAQQAALPAAHGAGARFIYWCQDFYALAVTRILGARMPGAGQLIGQYYQHLERRQMRAADHVIHITEAFRPRSEAWGVPRACTSVIPNWGPLDALPVMPRDTAWAREAGLGAGPRFLYSGTLALKHDPGLLSGLAETLSDGEVVAVAAGQGADGLAIAAPPRLRRLPLQPFDRLAEVLGAADVLLAVIERAAGTFSVPSKLLSYLCAARPVVLAAPEDNLAARILLETGAGVVTAPGDRAGFAAAARAFAADPLRAAAAGTAGRAYAEEHFPLPRVAARFEAVFAQTMEARAA